MIRIKLHDLIREMREIESHMHQDDYDEIIEIILKEWPVKPEWVHLGSEEDNSNSLGVYCSSCKHEFEKRNKHCPNCGQKIDWEE